MIKFCRTRGTGPAVPLMSKKSYIANMKTNLLLTIPMEDSKAKKKLEEGLRAGRRNHLAKEKKPVDNQDTAKSTPNNNGYMPVLG